MQSPLLKQTSSSPSRSLLGVAMLHSLLAHEEIQRHESSKNASLDLLALLQSDASATVVVQAFYRLKRSCERLAFLPVYKIRRWLESRLELRVDGEICTPVRLGFRTYSDLKHFHQYQVWEFSALDEAPELQWVRFDWKD